MDEAVPQEVLTEIPQKPDHSMYLYPLPSLSPMDTCGACNEEIIDCPICGGHSCSPGCPDREEDGCTCGEEDQ